MGRRRNWVLIVFGVAVVLVFIGIGAAIAVTAWFQQNMQVETATGRDAQGEFDVIRKKFGDREPLLEVRNGVPEYTASARAAEGSAAKLDSLHLLAWDPDDERLARISLPFWLLRMKSGPVKIGAYASGLDDGGVDLRPSDIEKYGPGVILDTSKADGQRVLIWAQ